MSENARLLDARLRAAFEPCEVTIRDESAAHAGHAGHGDGSHLAARVVAARFRGLRTLERHRLVYAAAGDLLSGALHALKVKAETPEEAAASRN
jgi:BolA family transcriptional regulator, general stress-responsive regulator